jgi:KaiC/GvpD/RAD55 family RecA-like ATPase
MSNKPKVFRRALDACSEQYHKTYHDIIPSISVPDKFDEPQPEHDTTDLWQGLWAQGEMACLFGAPCVGKSILAMQIAKELNDKGLSVIYFDFEKNVYPVTPIVETYSPENDEISPDERIDFIAREITDRKAQAVIIDDISFIVDSKTPMAMRKTLNKLRIICQHSGAAMLLLAHSHKRKTKDLTIPDELQHHYEIMHACDSVFSLATTSRMNSIAYRKTHYIKQHKNRMAPVIFSNDAVMATQLITTDDEHLVFTNFQENENERQLVRDNGFNGIEQRKKAIAHYTKLNYSTREIAAIVGISQAQVSRIAKALQEPTSRTEPEQDPEMQQKENEYIEFMTNLIANQKIQPQASLASKPKPTDASDSCNERYTTNHGHVLDDTVYVKKPVRNTNSSLKKLMKKSRNNNIILHRGD